MPAALAQQPPREETRAAVSTADSPWVKRRTARSSSPAWTLVCFPFAGGGAGAFEKLQPGLLPGVELLTVQYPGRDERWREPGVPSLNALADALSDALAPAAGGRCAFWGHSFGALTAFETARRLFHRNGALPARLFLSGARAPQLYKKERIHALNDKLFLERLRAFGGIPEEVLRDASLMQAFLPVIRHDFKLFEEHRFLAGDPLPVSISVFGGAGDSEVPVPDVLAWAVHTNRSFRSRFMDGGHFFPFTEIKQMTVFLREDMEAC